MKLRLKYSKIALTVCLVLLASCGKKENKVNSNAVPGVTPVPVSVNNPFGTSTNSIIIDQYNKIRASVACLPGKTRLAHDVNFFITGGPISETTINGSWQPGIITTGTVTNMYVGVGIYRDLMFLTKVTNGSQIVGYNVTLSYCDVPNLISNDIALVNFQTPYGITINTATPCGYGLIAAAVNTVMNPNTFPIVTSFTKPSCQ